MAQKSIFGRLFTRIYNTYLKSEKTGQEEILYILSKFIKALLTFYMPLARGESNLLNTEENVKKID